MNISARKEVPKTRVCCHCSRRRPAVTFQFFNGRPSGWCRSCRTALARTDRRARGIHPKRVSHLHGSRKFCPECSRIKPLASFSPAARGRGGRAAYCKPCLAKRQRLLHYDKLKTYSWRARNPERWKAAHRVHQFNRNRQQRAASDGTVTVQVVKALYAQDACAYCDAMILPEDRTLDHKVPLGRGGPHSAVNLVMACFTCNSSKGSLTAEEYLERINA